MMLFASGFYNRNHSRNKDTADTLIKWWSDNPYAYSLSTSTIYQIYVHNVPNKGRHERAVACERTCFWFYNIATIMRWS